MQISQTKLEVHEEVPGSPVSGGPENLTHCPCFLFTTHTHIFSLNRIVFFTCDIFKTSYNLVCVCSLIISHTGKFLMFPLSIFYFSL